MAVRVVLRAAVVRLRAYEMILLLLGDRLTLGCRARLLARIALRLDLRARRLAGLTREVMRVPRLRLKQGQNSSSAQ